MPYRDIPTYPPLLVTCKLPMDWTGLPQEILDRLGTSHENMFQYYDIVLHMGDQNAVRDDEYGPGHEAVCKLCSTLYHPSLLSELFKKIQKLILR